MPQIAEYPRCSECKHPWVLKLVMVFDKETKLIYQDFVWARDCRHKKASPEIVEHSIPGESKRRTKSYSKRAPSKQAPSKRSARR